MFYFHISFLIMLYILYTGQKQTQQNYQQVVPKEVTCNPTDDTARNDELSRSFAPNCHDYHHGAYYSTNPTNKHQNRFAFPSHDTNQAHQMQHGIQIHPMLPPIAIEQDSMHLQQHDALNEYHNCQMNLPHTQVYASYNQQNY